MCPLLQFIEKFQEVKEATRSAAQQKAQQQQQNGSIGTPVTSSSVSPCPSSRSNASHRIDSSSDDVITSNTHLAIDPMGISSTSLQVHQNDISSLKSPLVAHQRSQSLSGLQGNKVKIIIAEQVYPF